MMDDVNGVRVGSACSVDKDLKVERSGERGGGGKVGEVVGKGGCEKGVCEVVFEGGG